MMSAWVRSVLRRWTKGGPANVNSNRPPPGPPPRVQTRPSALAPDLEFVGTRDLFTAIASRYEACIIICARRVGSDDETCSVVFLSNGINDRPSFLRAAASLSEGTRARDLRDGDL